MRCLVGMVFCLFLITGCGGSSQSDDTGKSSSTQQKAAASGDSRKGIGPIKEMTLAPIDDVIVAQGLEIFDTKCSACHKWDERYVGPPLAGITKRREPEWIMNMMLNPDEMIKHDEQARALFTEYLTPMTFQNVSEKDAEAILMYFRSMDAGAVE